jgi:hypothetical protein
VSNSIGLADMIWQDELQERKDTLNSYFEHLWVLVEWLVKLP